MSIPIPRSNETSLASARTANTTGTNTGKAFVAFMIVIKRRAGSCSGEGWGGVVFFWGGGANEWSCAC